MNSHSESYKAAGVDVTAGYKAVELMKSHIARTRVKGVLGGLGGFGGMFEPDFTGMKHPVLVSGTDGVGTKLKIAFQMDKHDTVGIDLVAMCVNDIACLGAKPLFFLDYIAVDKNVPEKVACIVSGVAEGCVQAGCALIGGETAEMPGVYSEGEYDLAGFSTGAVDKDAMLDPENAREGDVIIAIASSGLHSNGYSLVRRALAVESRDLGEYIPELGETLGECLLTPTKIYVKPILALVEQGLIKTCANITGGGFFENIPRALPKNMSAVIDTKAVEILPIFPYIQRMGNIPTRDMFNTFNMGVGMVVVASPDKADSVIRVLKEQGEHAYVLGRVEAGESTVKLL